jgi:hypothetical protein
MTNVNLLKSIMARAGDVNFVGCLSRLLDVNRSTASRKLNGDAEFRQSEIMMIAEHYHLIGEEIKQIFVGA